MSSERCSEKGSKSLFKTKKVNQRKLRQRKRTASSDEDEDGSGADGARGTAGETVEAPVSLAQKLAEVRDEQRVRRRSAGTDVANIMTAPKLRAEVEEAALAAAAAAGKTLDDEGKTVTYGLVDPKKVAAEAEAAAGEAVAKIDRMLSGFATQRDKGADHEAHADKMESYVDQKLGKKEASLGTASFASIPRTERQQAALSLGEEHQQLYNASLAAATGDSNGKVTSSGARVAAQLAGKVLNEEGRMVEANEGVGVAWNTGLAEVELPIEFKLRNIEATEAAKAAKLAAVRAPGDCSDIWRPQAGGSLTANYNKHRRDWAIDQREQEEANDRSAQGL